jgi:signal recognition particle receptor subunit beta
VSFKQRPDARFLSEILSDHAAISRNRVFPMAFVNLKKKEIQLKIVYYGPGGAGKTTNLVQVYKKIRPQASHSLISISTQGDRTLFFDFLPVRLGRINGFNLVIQLYTVPGQIKYNATRRLVLMGVDGVVFVASSLYEERQRNIWALKNLNSNLASYNLDPKNVPCVLQYNKTDLSRKGIKLLSFDTLEKDLNAGSRCPSFAASALMGHNIMETLKKIVTMTLRNVKNELATVA